MLLEAILNSKEQKIVFLILAIAVECRAVASMSSWGGGGGGGCRPKISE